MVHLLLLGPVRVELDGRQQVLSIRKAQALLLMLAEGQTLPRSRLCALLWPDLAETDARRNLRREMARLRELCPATLLHADGDLLRLADGVSTDERAFTDALQMEQPDEALALWRGPLADGLRLDDSPAFQEWLDARREQVAALRRRALQASAAAHEARGRIAEALDRVQALLAEDAFQERHHRDAMRLLAACGHREAAVLQFERCRELLQAELGLQPMAETLALLQTLRGPGHALAEPLAAKPPAAKAPRSVVQQLATRMPWVGREAELQQLQVAWDQGRILLISGVGGIGKTRLALDFAAARGPYLLVHARPGDAEMPYASFAAALRALAGPAHDAPELLALPQWVRQELARLLPALGPPPPLQQTPADRLRFIEACAQAWTALTADAFDSVVFDDWHLADNASRSLMLRLGGQRDGPRVVIVYRPAEPGTAVNDWLLGWREAGPCFELQLAPLSAEAVLGLVQRLSGAAEPTRFAARLHRATGGNPFFLVETLRHLAEQGLLGADATGRWHTPFDGTTDDYRELPLPASVRDAVLQRVARLGAAAHRMLEAASLAGQPFEPALLAPACALSETEALWAVELAVQAQLLRMHEHGGVSFAHDLVQQALEASLAPDRRRLIHQRLALAAEAAGAAAAAAAHFEAGGQPARAVAHRLAAGKAADAVFAVDEALAHWQQGLDDGPSAAQAAELRLRMLYVLRRLHRSDEVAVLAEALMPAWRDDKLAPLLRAQVAHVLALSLISREQHDDCLTLLDELPPELVAAAPDLLLAVRIDALIKLGRFEQALAVGDQLLTSPRQRRDATTSWNLPNMLANAAYTLNRFDLAWAHARSAMVMARASNDRAVANVLHTFGALSAKQGRWREAAVTLREAADMLLRTGSLNMQRIALVNLCAAHAAMNEPQAVLAVAQEGLALEGRGINDELTTHFLAAQVEAHAASGNLGLALQRLRQALQQAESGGRQRAIEVVLIAGLELLSVTGQLDLAASLTRPVVLDGLRLEPQAEVQLRLVLAESQLTLGDLDAAAAHLSRLPPGEVGEARVAVHARTTLAAMALARGDGAAALAGLPEDDEVGMNDAMRMRAAAIRLAALARLGSLDTPALLQGRGLVERAAASHALAGLRLHHVLRGLAAAGPHPLRRDIEAAQAIHLRRLADSLDQQPQARQGLLRRWSWS